MIISIVSFMYDYYGITLDAGYKYSHKMLKKAFNELRRCSFRYADENPELVGSGKIVYVKDDYGKTLPYVCPCQTLISSKEYEECGFTCFEKVNKNEGILEELLDMPTYMVGELLSKYKYKPSFYKLIKTELVSRGVYDNKIYRCIKEIDEFPEINDKLIRRREIRIKNGKGGKND